MRRNDILFVHGVAFPHPVLCDIFNANYACWKLLRRRSGATGVARADEANKVLVRVLLYSLKKVGFPKLFLYFDNILV